ncbi:MAG: ribbon-helix-helix protein, CopG family [Acidobacteria bacterium]|nr:ribbon-helix-helix protein, CopG family [Acidobacteriota bacterium]
MKTGVSLPDELFLSADHLAKRQGISRSKLYAVALAEYLAKHRDADVTSRLNEVLAEESSDIDPALRRAQARSVQAGKW